MKKGWNEVKVENAIMWESDHGTIFRTPEGQYVAAVPKVVKLGPFSDLEEAKLVAEDLEGNLERVLDGYNLSLTQLHKELKKD